jgi:hypothetical protein
MVSRFKLPVWIAAVGPAEATCHGLQFSYGVTPVHTPELPRDWNQFARRWVQDEGLPKELVVLTEDPSRRNLQTNPRMEIIDLRHGDIDQVTRQLEDEDVEKFNQLFDKLTQTLAQRSPRH